ncbi:Coenzyme F420 hydrogenase/dehydrogenase, beta subunit C-terminal domain [Pseudomonas sp. BW13M1]|uniref:Coenzyme F420 hydrogenase/dehydrogenase, beta subunit C-terminal domain n=1 Tax=Pseudomonas peradeniyensis TaxID=2745488 RepID=A0A923K0I9_9PSED|nr:Coenzyme F420 hydrogenase/dehydrogenase, beta subunit C-terminal domain [Pseudomonas peradeniyensis]MBV4504368.1 Coenzyme F420 hydrogenase/dehydrogenase, beta subunit C-terminal domain [Pseudomonas peradeniyensis]
MRVTELPANVVAKGLCIGCGMCTAANAGREKPLLHMAYSAEHDHAIPLISAGAAEDLPEVVCPGASMHMPQLSEATYGSIPQDSWVGHHQRIRAAHSTDEEVRKRSASGGVTTALLTYLFEKQAIDAAYCVVSEGPPGNRSGKILRHAADLATIHGSVYQPAVLGADLCALIEGSERFAFVGLPCEIAAFEILKQKDPRLAQRHVLSIGLFCGGINRFAGIDYYLRRFGTGLEGATSIDYRYGAWPGKIRLVDAQGKAHEIARIRGNSRWNILRYVVGFQGYWMLPRCRMCPDQISDFADIAVGDPHLPRFRSKLGLGHSAVVLRSDRGVEWYDKALADGFITDEPLQREELIESQGYTLDNRRHALAYSRVARKLGMAAPDMSTYPEFERPGFRHYKYAMVDLLKIRLRGVRQLRLLYIPIQVFEYLFITLAPRVFVNRLVNLFRNK